MLPMKQIESHWVEVIGVADSISNKKALFNCQDPQRWNGVSTVDNELPIVRGIEATVR